MCVGHHYGLMDLHSFGVSKMSSLARVDLFKSPNWHILRFLEFLWCHIFFGLSSTFPATNSIICHFFRKLWFLLVGKRPRLLKSSQSRKRIPCSLAVEAQTLSLSHCWQMGWHSLPVPAGYFGGLKSIRCPVASTFFCIDAGVMQLLSEVCPYLLVFGGLWEHLVNQFCYSSCCIFTKGFVQNEKLRYC